MAGDYLWRLVIGVKYGEAWGDWIFEVLRRPYGCSLWRGIRVGWEEFAAFLSFVVRDGQKIQFWHDLWCGEQALKNLLLDLFLMDKNKDDYFFSFLDSKGDDGSVFGILDSFKLSIIGVETGWFFLCICSNQIFQLLVELIVWDGTWIIMVNLMFGLIMKP